MTKKNTNKTWGILLLLLLIVIILIVIRKLKEAKSTDPDNGDREIICDKCQNGYPVSMQVIGKECPKNSIPSGTGNPCPPASVVVDTGHTTATPETNFEGGLYTGDVLISPSETTTAAPLTDRNIDSTMLGTYGCMDVNALNYDPNAGVDDGSCYYTIGNDAWLIECCNPNSPSFSPTCATNPICQCQNYMCD